MNKSTLTLCAVLAVFGVVFATVMGMQAEENVAEAFDRPLDAQADAGAAAADAEAVRLAPGFTWTYAPGIPGDLIRYTEVVLVDDGGIAELHDGVVTATMPEGTTLGKEFDLRIGLRMTEPLEQYAEQDIVIVAVEGLSVSGTPDNAVIGGGYVFEPTGTSGMGEVSWSVKDGTTLPDGLSLNDGRVSGTAGTLGKQTMHLVAEAAGETRDLTVSFTVFPAIAGGEDETIRSYGTKASSSAVANSPDLEVRWSVASGTMPDGFSLDPGTGIVSGRSSKVQDRSLVLTGTSTAEGCPLQTSTKKVTVLSEPALNMKAGDRIATYIGNRAAVSSVVSFSATSAIAWSVDYAGASVSNGTVSVTNPARAVADQSIRVTAETAYGQKASVIVKLDVEDVLSLSCDPVETYSGSATTAKVAVSGGSGNTLAVSSDRAYVETWISGTTLSLYSDSPATGVHITITARSVAGQTASVVIAADFSEPPATAVKPIGGASACPA